VPVNVLPEVTTIGLPLACFGNVQLFFELETRKSLVPADIQVPGVLIFFGKKDGHHE
jgi:hypothetical protein